MSQSKIVQESAFGLAMTNVADAALDLGDDAFDDFAEPYGPLDADEASWFAPARDEREALALVERLLGR